MNIKTLLLFITIFILGSLGIYFFVYEKQSPEEPKNIRPFSINEVASKSEKSLKKERSKKITNENQEKIKDQMKKVSSRYEQSIQYPDYSVSIEEDSYLLSPNKNPPSKRDYNQGGMNGTLIIGFDKYRYERGEKAEIVAVAQGDASFFSTLKEFKGEVSGVDAQYDFKSTGQDTGQKFYELTLDTSDFSGEKVFTLQVRTTDDELISQSTSFMVFESVGEIVSLGSYNVKNNELVMPIVVDVEKSGFYHLSANMLHKESKEPITHLQGDVYSKRSGEIEIDLKAHGRHFIDKDVEGEFLLKNFQIKRKPVKPGPDKKVMWGGNSDKELFIDGVDKRDFEDVPYQSDLNQARLDFLREGDIY